MLFYEVLDTKSIFGSVPQFENILCHTKLTSTVPAYFYWTQTSSLIDRTPEYNCIIQFCLSSVMIGLSISLSSHISDSNLGEQLLSQVFYESQIFLHNHKSLFLITIKNNYTTRWDLLGQNPVYTHQTGSLFGTSVPGLKKWTFENYNKSKTSQVDHIAISHVTTWSWTKPNCPKSRYFYFIIPKSFFPLYIVAKIPRRNIPVNKSQYSSVRTFTKSIILTTIIYCYLYVLFEAVTVST